MLPEAMIDIAGANAMMTKSSRLKSIPDYFYEWVFECRLSGRDVKARNVPLLPTVYVQKIIRKKVYRQETIAMLVAVVVKAVTFLATKNRRPKKRLNPSLCIQLSRQYYWINIA
jgi:hypothetical protein